MFSVAGLPAVGAVGQGAAGAAAAAGADVLYFKWERVICLREGGCLLCSTQSAVGTVGQRAAGAAAAAGAGVCLCVCGGGSGSTLHSEQLGKEQLAQLQQLEQMCCVLDGVCDLLEG